MVALLPLYHPVEAAEQIATLDVISGGKFVLAPALGLARFSVQRLRNPQGPASLPIPGGAGGHAAALTKSRVTHHGQHFQMEDVPGGGAPLQKPYPRMYLAANQDRGVVRAARQADGWLVSSRATLTTLRQQVPVYQEAASTAGKAGYISAWREMFIAETREKAIEIARPHVEWLYQDRAASGHSQELPATDRIDVPFEQVLEGRFIIGSPDECAEEIKKYQELGIQELILRCKWPGMPNQDSNRAVGIIRPGSAAPVWVRSGTPSPTRGYTPERASPRKSGWTPLPRG